MVSVTSRTLTPTEKKWDMIEKEMLAIKYGCKKFRPFILGRPTVVFTDHDPLRGIMRKIDLPNKRLQGMKLYIAEFDLILKYVPTADNKADFWTRLGVGPEDDDLEVMTVQTVDVKWDSTYSAGCA